MYILSQLKKKSPSVDYTGNTEKKSKHVNIR